MRTMEHFYHDTVRYALTSDDRSSLPYVQLLEHSDPRSTWLPRLLPHLQKLPTPFPNLSTEPKSLYSHGARSKTSGNSGEGVRKGRREGRRVLKCSLWVTPRLRWWRLDAFGMEERGDGEGNFCLLLQQACFDGSRLEIERTNFYRAPLRSCCELLRWWVTRKGPGEFEFIDGFQSTHILTLQLLGDSHRCLPNDTDNGKPRKMATR